MVCYIIKNKVKDLTMGKTRRGIQIKMMMGVNMEVEIIKAGLN